MLLSITSSSTNRTLIVSIAYVLRQCVKCVLNKGNHLRRELQIRNNLFLKYFLWKYIQLVFLLEILYLSAPYSIFLDTGVIKFFLNSYLIVT